MNIIWSEKIKLIQILLGLKNHPNTNIKKIHPNTNTNIIRLKKSPEYEYEYYSVWKNHPNTNTNIIRFENIDRIRIRIFWYSNIIRIIFEYRIICSPLSEKEKRKHNFEIKIQCFVYWSLKMIMIGRANKRPSNNNGRKSYSAPIWGKPEFRKKEFQ